MNFSNSFFLSDVSNNYYAFIISIFVYLLVHMQINKMQKVSVRDY